MFRKLKIFLLLSTILYPAFSQNLDYYEKIKSKYNDHSIVELNYIINIEIKLVDDKLKVIENFSEEAMLLKDDASSYNSYSVYSNSMIKLNNFTSKTKVLKGKSYKSYDNENIETVNDLGSSSFYDDQKKHTVHLENLQKGSIRKINYELNYEDAHFFGMFQLWNYIPTENLEINIKCPKSVDLDSKCINCNEDIAKSLNVKEEGKYRVYKLNLKDLPENKRFNGSPNYKWYLPHLVMRVKSYETSTGQKKYLNDVNDLYTWYSSLIKHLPKLNNLVLIQITDSLVKNAPTEEEKVNNVFKWVQKNIKYVAFEDGMGGYVPRDPSLVFQKKYGDCKDMAFLIYSMLNQAGIKSYLTWIGTRSMPYSYSKLPSPLINDHMIACYVNKNNNHTFLDATDKQITFGFPSSFTQGKQGLLGETEKFIDTVFVPVIPAYKSVKTDSSFLRIEDQKLKGTSRIYFTGYKRFDFLGDISRKKADDQKDYYRFEFEKGNNKFFQNDVKLTEQYNDTTSLLTFDFEVNDYIKKINNEQYINLNLEKDLPLYIFEDNYTTPYELDYSFINKYVRILNVPAGYKVSYLPDNYSFSSSDYTVDIKYELKGEKVINTFTFRVNPLMIEQKELGKWNDFIANINKQRNNTVSLQLKN